MPQLAWVPNLYVSLCVVDKIPQQSNINFKDRGGRVWFVSFWNIIYRWRLLVWLLEAARLVRSEHLARSNCCIIINEIHPRKYSSVVNRGIYLLMVHGARTKMITGLPRCSLLQSAGICNKGNGFVLNWATLPSCCCHHELCVDGWMNHLTVRTWPTSHLSPRSRSRNGINKQAT